jgi:hypothetical protein
MGNELDSNAKVLGPRKGIILDEKLLTNWRVQFVEFAFLLASFLTNTRGGGFLPEHKKELTAVLKQCLKLSEIPDQEGKVVIRFRGRGIPGESGDSEKFDYVFRYGNMEIDIPLIKSVAKRGGVATSHLPWRLLKSFEGLAILDINSLFLDIGTCQKEELENVQRSLEIMGNYFFVTGSFEGSGVTSQGRSDLPAVIYSEKSLPDPNLTLLAAYNSIKSKAVQDLVFNIDQQIQQADPDSPLKKCVSVYEAIFHFKKLRDQLRRPPVEVNNVRWLMVSEEQEVVDKQDVPITQEIMNRLLNVPLEKVTQILASIYGSELLGYSATELISWLEQVAELLKTIQEERGQDNELATEILKFIEKGLDHIADEILNNLTIEGEEVLTETENEKKIRLQLPKEFLALIDYYIKRSSARGKMRAMLSQQVRFSEGDLQAIAADFQISKENTKELLVLLQNCFDKSGRYQRREFEKNIPEFLKYEKNIFQFLWHYLSEINNRNDRVSYLNTLQLLISEMREPGDALMVLLADFIQAPMQVTFFDRNAMILSNILLRKYNQELRNEIEITPEEVLMVREGLDQERVAAAAEQVEKLKDKFNQKIRLIHEKLEEALNPRAIPTTPMPIRYLITLEREVYIFMSLIGGAAAHRIVRDAAEEYGNPVARIYRLETSSQNVPAIMQLLKVIIRALDRFADVNDLSLLQEIRNQDRKFQAKVQDNQYLVVKRVMEWVDRSIKKLKETQDEQ